MATIGTSSDQNAVLTAMKGVDPKKNPQVYIGGFNRYYGQRVNWSWIDGTPFRFYNLVGADSRNECMAFINSGNDRGKWKAVPCNNTDLLAWICSVRAK